LDYLHSHTPAIIHRDLTATNVLLTSQLTAKITDFGNCRFLDLDPSTTSRTFTTVHGTLEYMPPEAQGVTAQGVSKKFYPSLDVFSFGHLSLFTVTQTQVTLLPPTSTDPETGLVKGLSALQRREEFVTKAQQLLPENPDLVQLIQQCLHNLAAKRPLTRELVEKLSSMTAVVIPAGQDRERVERDSASTQGRGIGE
jgi:serine/threonine protein kinase